MVTCGLLSVCRRRREPRYRWFGVSEKGIQLNPSLWPELVVHLGIDPLQRPPQVRGVAEGDVVLCESPGVMAPGFTPVLVSNDGASFTDECCVLPRIPDPPTKQNHSIPASAMACEGG